jgi:hypothetical protein
LSALPANVYASSNVEGAKTIGKVSQKLALSAYAISPCPVNVGVPVLGPSR